MEKAFKDFLKKELTAFLSGQGGWRSCAAPKGSFIAGKSILWRRAGPQGHCAYLLCFFHEKRSEVQLFLGWSAEDAFPSIDALMEGQGRLGLTGTVQERAAAALDVMRSASGGWVDAMELGLPQLYGLATDVPPMSRLESVFDAPANAKEVEIGLLQGSGFDHWRQATMYHSWSMVAYFDKLTPDDANVAVGGTRDELLDVLDKHYLPLAGQYLSV